MMSAPAGPHTRASLEQVRWQETLEAMASVGQGKLVAGDVVHAWLDSWGSAGELPPPRIANTGRHR
ncbi:MAG: hypothetical protein ACREPV_12055 [Lysobacter sp.]